MKQVIVPFLLYLALQIPVLLTGMAVRKPEIRPNGLIRSWIFGQMTLFAVLELLAVPMIFFHVAFNTLYISFCACAGVLVALGIYRLIVALKNPAPAIPKEKEPRSPLAWILLGITFLIVLYQFLKYLLGMHLDEDDSRWLAQANDALETGKMIYHNYNTGDSWGWVHMSRDGVSAWPMLYSILSRLTLNTRVTILAHTVYAPMELLAVYGIYWLLADELFKKKDARATFLLLVAVINLFYAGTVYTQSVFSLVRIWQGKASVAAVIIPLLLYLFVRVNKENRVSDWLMLAVVDCAACLMSGMGISIAAIMIGIYGAYHIIAYRHWKRIPLLLLAVLPSVFYALLYVEYYPLAEYIFLGRR